jgi:hypothetical protein
MREHPRNTDDSVIKFQPFYREKKATHYVVAYFYKQELELLEYVR